MHRTSVIRAAVAASILSFSIAAHSARAEDASTFDLPAQPLVDSLRAVASQTKLNVFFEPKVIAGKQAPAVEHAAGVEVALRKLLEGTGLTFRFVDERTVSVMEERKE